MFEPVAAILITYQTINLNKLDGRLGSGLLLLLLLLTSSIVAVLLGHDSRW